MGDIIQLSEGDIVPIDCLLIGEALISVDESIIRGAPKPYKKNSSTNPYEE